MHDNEGAAYGGGFRAFQLQLVCQGVVEAEDTALTELLFGFVLEDSA